MSIRHGCRVGAEAHTNAVLLLGGRGSGTDWVGKTISDVTIKGQGNDLVLDLSKVYATATPGACPILPASYELVCSKYPDAQVGTAVKAFMQSTITTGARAHPVRLHPTSGRLPDQGCRRDQRHQLRRQPPRASTIAERLTLVAAVRGI
ncbi:hypothetical protein [Mycobacterium sp.]|uniref:hypothetical protein n=1 Tax=Mycobacterium sp. TaxID=1785 RepID=UPI003BB0918E